MWQTMEILRFCENSWSYHSQASSFDQEKMLSNMVKKINETGALKKDIVKNLMTIWIMRFPGRILTPGWEAAASSLQLHNTNSGAICHVAAPLLSSPALQLPPGTQILHFNLFSSYSPHWQLSYIYSGLYLLSYIYSGYTRLNRQTRCTMHEVDGCWRSISTEINISFIWRWRKISQFSDWKK